MIFTRLPLGVSAVHIVHTMLRCGPQNVTELQVYGFSLVLGVPWPVEWAHAPVYETPVWWISVINDWWVRTEIIQVATLLNYIWEVPSSDLDQDAEYYDWGFSWHSSFPADKCEIVFQVREFSALSCPRDCSCHHTVLHYIVWAVCSCNSTDSPGSIPGSARRALS